MRRLGRVLILGMLGLSSCVAPTPAPGAPKYSKVGAVLILDLGLGAGALVMAGFNQAQTPLEAPQDLYPGLDTCTLAGAVPTPPPTLGSTPLDAGRVRLTRGAVSTQLEQKPDRTYTGSLTSLPLDGDTLEIEGAAAGFPAFSGVALPQVSDWTLSSSAPDQDAVFSWSGAGSARLPLLLNFALLDGDTISGTFSCTPRDDGSFSIPAAFRAQLSGKGIRLLSSSRMALNTVIQADVLLNVIALRSKIL